MKSKIIESTKGVKTIEEYAQKIWNAHKKDLSTDGEGERITEKYMKTQLKIRFNEILEEHPAMTKKQAMKEAAMRYQFSSDYFSAEERISSFSIRDFIQSSDAAEIRRFQSLTRGEKGKFQKFDPNKVRYITAGKVNGRYRTVSIYMNVIKLSFNSPEEVYFFSKNAIPEEFEIYLQGVNLD